MFVTLPFNLIILVCLSCYGIMSFAFHFAANSVIQLTKSLVIFLFHPISLPIQCRIIPGNYDLIYLLWSLLSKVMSLMAKVYSLQ